MTLDTTRLPTISDPLTTLNETNTDGGLHALVINQLMRFGGNAVWIDADNNAQTHRLVRLSPHPDILDRITVARAFTPYQHHALVRSLPDCADRDTELFVFPAIDRFYMDETLSKTEARTLLTRSIEIIDRETERYDAPALLTTISTRFDAIIDTYCTETITCTETQEGIRFETGQFETLTYQGPGYIQTTLRLWETILKTTYRQKKTTQPMVTVDGTQ